MNESKTPYDCVRVQGFLHRPKKVKTLTSMNPGSLGRTRSPRVLKNANVFVKNKAKKMVIGKG